MKLKLLILFLLVNGILFAQKTDYATAIEMLQKINSADYPEANTMNIKNTFVNIDSNCLGTREKENYKLLLTENGKKQSSQVYYYYDSDYDSIKVELIEIIKKDGNKIVDLTKQDNILLSTNRNLIPKAKNFDLLTLIDKSKLSEYQVEYKFLGLNDKRAVNLALWPIADLSVVSKSVLPDFIQIDEKVILLLYCFYC